MATFTENYSLIKPDEADYYDIADWNENMDTIDAALETAAAQTEGISEKIGTAADGAEAETIFGKLAGLAAGGNEGVSVIKSIQRVICNLKKTESTTLAIQTVNPAKCFVITERLSDENDAAAKAYSYTLGADSITATANTPTWDLIIGFWVVEFI